MSKSTSSTSSTKTQEGKAIRMRHTFSNSAEVCHQWANQRDQGDGSRDYGKNGSGNCSFNGAELRSYSTAIARRYDELGIVLFTTEEYSRTTNGHMSDAKRAMRGHDRLQLDVPCVDVSPVDASNWHAGKLRKHLQNYAKLWNDTLQCLDSFLSNSHSTTYAENYLEALTNFFAYVKAFKLSRLLSSADRKILRMIEDSGKSIKNAKKPVETIPQNSSLEHERDWLKDIQNTHATSLAYKIAEFIGSLSDDHPALKANHYETFKAYLESYYSEESAIKLQAMRKANSERLFQRSAADQNYRQFNGMNSAELLKAWKTKVDGIDSFLKSHSYVGTYGRIAQAIREHYGAEFNRDLLLPWKDGKPQFYAYYGDNFRAMRLQDKIISTSGGIHLPAKEFLLFWKTCGKMLWNARHNPAELNAVAIQVRAIIDKRKVNRSFSLEAIDYATGSMKFGCHLLAWDDLNSLAVELGETSLPWRMRALPAPMAN